MTILKAHFDGKVLVPDEPLDLPINCALEVQVRPVEQSARRKTPLQQLAEALKELPTDINAPADGAAQHDHYLFGTSKRS